jgi:hypothetical protein
LTERCFDCLDRSGHIQKWKYLSVCKQQSHTVST